MIKPSSIASFHHYYVLFLSNPKITSIGSLIKYLSVKKKNIELLCSDESFGEIYHIQLEIDVLNSSYGSVNVMESNRVHKNKDIFAYDMYVGTFDLESKKKYFLAYPYKGLEKYLKINYPIIFKTCVFDKPLVETVLNYIKERPYKSNDKESNINKNIEVDIIKYSAEIKEGLIKNAKKMSLIGENPVNSKVYDILNNSMDVTIKPLSLKLKCVNEMIGDIELLFDKHGNYRFWIPKNMESERTSMLPSVLTFLNSIKALKQNSYMTSHSAIDDKDE